MLSGKTFYPILLSACLVIVLTSMFLLTYVNQYTENHIVDWLDRQNKDELRYDKISIKFPGDIQIYNLRPANASDQNLKRFHIRLLKIRIKLLSFFKKKLEFSYIGIEGMRSTICRDGQDGWNVKILDNVFKSIADSSAPPVLVDRFSLIESEMIIGDSKLPLEIKCIDFNLFMRHSWQEQPKLEGRFAISQAEVVIDNRVHLFEKVRSRFNIENAILNLSTSTSYFQFSRLNTELQIEISGEYAINGKIKIKPNLPELSRRYNIPDSILTGNPAIHYSFSGILKDFSLKGDVEVDRIQISKIPIHGFQATLELNKNGCYVSNFEGAVADGLLIGDLQYDREARTALVDYKLRNAKLERALELFQIESKGFKGNLDCDGHFDVQYPHFELRSVSAECRFSDIAYKKRFVPSSRLILNLENTRLRINYSMMPAIVLRFDGEIVYNALTYRIPNIEFKRSSFTGEIADFAIFESFLDLPDLSGHLRYSGFLIGALKNPKFSINARWDSCSISDVRFDSLKSHIKYQDKLVSECTAVAYNHNFPVYIDYESEGKNSQRSICIISPDSSLFNSGHKSALTNCIFISSGEHSRKSKIAIREFQLSDISNFYYGDDKFSGHLNGEGHFRYLLQIPEIALTFNVTDFISDIFQLESITSDITYRHKSIDIRNITLTHEGGSAHISGKLPYDPTGNENPPKPVDLSLKSTGFPLSCYSKFKKMYVTDHAVSNFDIKITGDWANPVLKGRIGAAIENLKSKYSNSRLQDVTIGAQLDGTLYQPEFFIDWQSANLNWQNFHASSFDGSLTYADSVVHLKNVLLKLAENTSELNGRIPFVISLIPPRIEKGNKFFELTSRADELDLSLLAPVIPVLENINGKLNYDFEISGTFKEPIVFGRVDIDNTEIKFKNLDPQIMNFDAGIQFTGMNAKIDTCKAIIGDGYFTITGGSEIQFPGATRAWDLEADFRNIALHFKKYFETDIDSGQLVLQGSSVDSDITGNIAFEQLKITNDIVPTELNQLESTLNFCGSGEDRTRNPFGIAIDLAFKEPIEWDNRELSIWMLPDIRIHGNVCQPTLDGVIRLTDGSFQYLNRRFLISNGELKFEEAAENNPKFDIRAKTLVRSYENSNQKNYLITLSLTGDMNDYEYNLHASPDLPQHDIIAILTKGKLREPVEKKAITSKKRSFSEILAERARTLTTRSLESLAERQVGTLLNLDEVDVKWNYSGKNSRKGTRIVASKKITSELGITYMSVVGYANDQAIKLEYKISDTVSLEGEADEKGRTGMDLKFKYNFK